MVQPKHRRARRFEVLWRVRWAQAGTRYLAYSPTHIHAPSLLNSPLLLLSHPHPSSYSPPFHLLNSPHFLPLLSRPTFFLSHNLSLPHSPSPPRWVFKASLRFRKLARRRAAVSKRLEAAQGMLMVQPADAGSERAQAAVEEDLKTLSELQVAMEVCGCGCVGVFRWVGGWVEGGRGAASGRRRRSRRTSRTSRSCRLPWRGVCVRVCVWAVRSCLREEVALHREPGPTRASPAPPPDLISSPPPATPPSAENLERRGRERRRGAPQAHQRLSQHHGAAAGARRAAAGRRRGGAGPTEGPAGQVALQVR
jgi:hypothetical protein